MVRLLTALAAALVFAAFAAGCRTTSCDDVCAHQDSCNEQLGQGLQNRSTCLSNCHTSYDPCTNEGDVLDCLHTAACVNLSSWWAAEASCAFECTKQ